MSYRVLHSVCDTPIGNRAADMDLPEWLFHLSNQDYQACSKGHIAAGTSTQADGNRTSVNVETVGGHLMVQHYVPEIEKPDHLKLVSVSDCWLFRVWYVRFKVTWDIKLLPVSDGTSLFRNTVTVEHRNPVMKILTAMVLGGFFLKKHNFEETPLFAENLAKKASR